MIFKNNFVQEHGMKSKVSQIISILIIFFLFVSCNNNQENVEQYDIVIYGGNSAGISAAIQSARLNKSVLLIATGKHLGGLTTGGLGQTDIGNKFVIGGIVREFYQNVYKYYLNKGVWKYEKKEDYRGGVKDWEKDNAWWQFEPHVAEKVYHDMLSKNKVQIIYNERLVLKDGVVKEKNNIHSKKLESGKLIQGKVFVDATYEGDLLAQSGVSFTFGRESNSIYGETLNGVQTKNAVYHQFVDNVDPYIEKGNPQSGVLPTIDPTGPGQEGEGDHRLQAYCFRMCLTDVKENQVPFTKPDKYDPLLCELLFRNFEAGAENAPLYHGTLPNRKTDTNNNKGFSTDYIGGNYNYLEANYEERDRIITEHLLYQQGLMWTLGNHKRVPESIRKEVSRWGLAKDEFTDTDHWPHQLYIREARRMISDYVMTEHNCRGKISVNNSVGMAAYTMDSHNVQRYVDSNGQVKNEGDVQVRGFPPYPISYESIIPKSEECSNLVVPVCLSASHIAFGSIRMEPVFMVLGQSAAFAASIAIDDDVELSNVNYAKLKSELIKAGQILSLN